MKYVSVTFSPSLNFNSPESWFERTAGYAGVLFCLAKNNTVINIKQINYEGDCVHHGVHYYFPNFKRKDTYFPGELNRFVKRLKPDIVFVQGLHNPIQLIQLAARLNKTAKIIVQHHAEKPSSGIKKFFQKMADKLTDAYLFASHELGEEWVKNGIISSAEKIHEVMEVSSIFSPMNKALARLTTGAKGSTVFLWVGRLNDNKDPLTVIKAFLRYAELNPGTHLYMIYHTGELLEQINALLAQSAQKDAITLVGKIPHADLQYWFNSADIILSGSHYEGSGTAVCEAMSCACMPIVTDISSFRMITDNGRCGLLYQPGNEESILSALKQTADIDVHEKQKLSLEYFQSNLSFEAIAKRIQEIAASL
ncbi:MAG TPA: glycosyltransferase family 4 protein [Mucilaginibacter sp.]|jgi:glycosyltransferase involved in cell wall biosynthesis|nr:glycosyltransferase family 4 protein [Mucilaginibacter sp.]